MMERDEKMTEPTGLNGPPPTPMLDKALSFKNETRILHEFLDWLLSQGYVLGGHQNHPECRLHFWNDTQYPCLCGIESRECWGMDEECPDREHHVDWVLRMPIRDRSTAHNELISSFLELDQSVMDDEHAELLSWIAKRQGETGND